MVRSADEQRKKGDRAIALTDRAYSVLVEVEDGVAKQVQKTLEDSYKQLEKKLLKQYSQYTSDAKPDLLPAQRTLILLQDLQTLLPLVNPQKAPTYTRQFEKLGKAASKIGVNLAQQIIETQEGKKLSAARQSGGIPIEAIAFAARDSTKRLQKHGVDFAQKSSAIIQMGLAQNWGGQKTAQLMRQELGVTKARAETIVRTESASAMVNAQILTYKSAGFGEYFQFICAGGSCGICGARNMQVYRVGSSQPPLHPRCRCTTMPWSREWQEAGLTNDAWAADYVEQIAPTLSTPLDPGVAPFERANGITTPPTPVWSLGQAPTPTTPATATPNRRAIAPDIARSIAKVQRGKLPDLDSAQLFESAVNQGEALFNELVETLGYDGFTAENVLAALRERSAITPEQAVEKAAQPFVTRGAKLKQDEAFLRETLADFHVLTSGRLDDLKRLDYREPRAFADDRRGMINIGDKMERWILMHEAAHLLEYQYPEIGATMREWRDRRATGPAQELSKITGNAAYEKGEVALQGDYPSPYMGRVYFDGATEVLATGLQSLASPGLFEKMVRADRELTYLMLGTLDKLQKNEYTSR